MLDELRERRRKRRRGRLCLCNMRRLRLSRRAMPSSVKKALNFMAYAPRRRPLLSSSRRVARESPCWGCRWGIWRGFEKASRRRFVTRDWVVWVPASAHLGLLGFAPWAHSDNGLDCVCWIKFMICDTGEYIQFEFKAESSAET